MRVTNRMLSNAFLADMDVNLQNMKKVQEQVTSGKEVINASDNPLKATKIMQLYTDIDANKQYNTNILSTINWLDTTDTALGQLGNVLQNIHEKMISAGDAAYSENERNSIKDELNEQINHFSQILNTNFNGKYIFGGTRGTDKPTMTLSDANGNTVLDYAAKNGQVLDSTKIQVTKGSNWNSKKIQFSIDGKLKEITLDSHNDLDNIADIANDINNKLKTETNGELKAQVVVDSNVKYIRFVSNSSKDVKITSQNTGENDSKLGESLSYEYNMINTKLNVEISQGVTMKYNTTASEIFNYEKKSGEIGDIRELFRSIVNHLEGKNDDGNKIDDKATDKLITDDLQGIKDALNNILTIRSEVGAKQNRMDSAKEKNEEENFNMTEILSKTQDIDITEKIMDYSTMLTVYRSALQTSAKVLQPSILDYLR